MTQNITKEIEKIAEDLGVDRKRSIGEVSAELKVKAHVIRFWEENFPQIKPEIGNGGRRYYYNKQLKVLRRIKGFLHEEGYTIAGLQKLLGRKNKGEFQEEKKQDLEVLRKETPADWSENSSEESPAKNSKIEIDDFLNCDELEGVSVKVSQEASKPQQCKIMPGTKVGPGSKLLDFANLEVPMVDLKVKREVNARLGGVRNNLRKLQILIDGGDVA